LLVGHHRDDDLRHAGPERVDQGAAGECVPDAGPAALRVDDKADLADVTGPADAWNDGRIADDRAAVPRQRATGAVGVLSPTLNGSRGTDVLFEEGRLASRDAREEGLDGIR